MKKQFCARLNTDWAADILASLKGHGFSRAADESNSNSALAAEGMKVIDNTFPQGLKPNIFFVALSARLKPCPFKASIFLFIGAAMLLATTAGLAAAQSAASAAPSATAAQSPATDTMPPTAPAPEKPTRNSDRRKAVKLYLASSQLFEKEQFEEAMRGYEEAARLDPDNRDYPLAAGVARSHAVTALIQAAAKDRLRNDAASARAALAHALDLDPKNAQVNQHLFELGDDALLGLTRPIYAQGASTAGEAVELAPTAGVHSFHLRADQRQIIQQVFKVYGIDATIDESVHNTLIRLDVDDAGFEAAARIMGMVTNSFYVPLDAHRALVARDTRENRLQFMRLETETVYLSGLSKEEQADVGRMAKDVFNAQQAVVDSSSSTITLRASRSTLNVFNATMSQLLDGRSQVLLEVRMIQLAHISQRNTGVQLPQQTTAVNVYAEEQSLLNANQSLVQQIISSGLASANDPLAILGILLASGQISSSLLSNGAAIFGGGLTLTGVSLSPLTANFNLNSSDSRELELMQLRLGDGEKATIKTGTRYPIQTSSFSSLSASLPNIPGLNGAGNSGSLSSLLASYAGSVPNLPQVEYQDLGLTLEATPKVMRSGDLALTIDLKIDALAGSSVNGNPVLSNRAWSGVVTVKQGEAVEVVSEVDKSESHAISGTPGISEIPGMNNLTSKDVQKNTATLLIVLTPHVIRGSQAAGHSPMMRVEREQQTR
jgi:Flp pilus assembly secretin CpaC